MDQDQLKKLAAEKAVEEIKDGMIIGLGSGSTAFFALEKISEKLKCGELKNIIGYRVLSIQGIKLFNSVFL